MTAWKHFEGWMFEGKFLLKTCLRGAETGATFATEFEGRPALIKLKPTEAPGWERMSASWTLAKRLQHPNLMSVYDCGLAELDDLRVAYALTEYPDAELSSVLGERRLTADEARELLLNCAQALKYLHAQNLVHTDVRPGAIFSVNERIKLDTDHLQKSGDAAQPDRSADPYTAPEAANSGFSAASDVWSLGATILHALTGNYPDALDDTSAQTPHAVVIRHCLAAKPEDRWTAAQIVESLSRAPAPPPVRPAPVKVAPPSGERRPDRKPGLLKYTIPVALILLVAVFWMFRRSPQPSPRAAAAPAPTVTTPAPVAPSTPTAPVEAVQQLDADRVREAPQVQPASRAPEWLVVVYTYARAADAERKAAEIDQKWPNLKAHVLVPHSGSPHLVVLGNGLDRAEALRLRSRALASGLPRDSYVQNF